MREREGAGQGIGGKPLAGPGGATVPSALARAWWAPVAVIAVVLLLLLLVPIVVTQRVGLVRRDVVDVADNARVQVNDLQAAYVARLYAHDARGDRTPAADSAEAANLAKEVADERALDSLVRRLGPVAASRMAVVTDRSKAWQSHLLAGRAMPLDTAVSRRGLELLSAAEALDEELLRISNAARDRVRFYAEVNLIATTILIPLALIALGMVLWVGWRLVTMAAAIDRERTELQRAIETRAALIRGVTHDVKNPLGAAIGYVELLQEGIAGAVQPEQQRMLQRVRRLMDTALGTVGELLDAARREHAVAGAHAAVDLRSIVADLVEDYSAMAHARAVQLRAAIGEGPVIAATDAARVRRIIGNLVSNAIKYGRDGGRVVVTVGLQAAERRCLLTVCDDGAGIPAEFRERLFGDFFRVPGSESRADGHGMGLAVSARLARALGGDLRLVESPLGGAGFALELPAA